MYPWDWKYETMVLRRHSALCGLKHYLRAIIKQERINNLLIIHVHKECTDSLDLK